MKLNVWFHCCFNNLMILIINIVSSPEFTKHTYLGIGIWFCFTRSLLNLLLDYHINYVAKFNLSWNFPGFWHIDVSFIVSVLFSRRRLTVCPILEGEDQLRLLNYQHNLIEVIEHLNCLKRLIFLDLYDNQIDVISGLSALKSLRVLMLGKNRCAGFLL